MSDVYVAGVGMTRFGCLEPPLVALLAEAGAVALRDAGIAEIQAIYVASMDPEELADEGSIASLFAAYIGRPHLPSLRIETGTSSGAAAFFAAWTAVASGYHDHVLVVAGEKMTSRPTPEVAAILSRMIDPYERSYGATMPALAALVARAYMEAHDLAPKDLAQVAVKNHANGARNPFAHFRRPITLEEALESRLVAEPLRLYDCCPISDGAAAAVLTRDRQRVRVAGIGHGADHLALRHRDSLTGFRATQAAARRAYAMAGRSPRDIQVAELHDAFTPFELISSEDVGFFEPGQGARALARGHTALGGDLPINPSGGLKARGHPVGASGLAQAVEIVWQLRGEAGERQVDARVGLTQSIGGLASNNFVIVLEAAA
jgi:acetyl-CoA C-acetyltransferase